MSLLRCTLKNVYKDDVHRKKISIIFSTLFSILSSLVFQLFAVVVSVNSSI